MCCGSGRARRSRRSTRATASGCAGSAELGRGRATLRVVEQRRPPEPDADLWLLFAPIKRARLDWLVEKATELGAAALVPVWTARTQPERLNRSGCAAIAIAAAEQSERLSVPRDPRRPSRSTTLLAGWPARAPPDLCDETGGGRADRRGARRHPARDARPRCWSARKAGSPKAELDALGKLPIVTRVGLGPRVLRAETAALAALAVFQAIAGDWRRRRPA